jgi:hypothetical protein
MGLGGGGAGRVGGSDGAFGRKGRGGEVPLHIVSSSIWLSRMGRLSAGIGLHTVHCAHCTSPQRRSLYAGKLHGPRRSPCWQGHGRPNHATETPPEFPHSSASHVLLHPPQLAEPPKVLGHPMVPIPGRKPPNHLHAGGWSLPPAYWRTTIASSFAQCLERTRRPPHQLGKIPSRRNAPKCLYLATFGPSATLFSPFPLDMRATAESKQPTPASFEGSVNSCGSTSKSRGSPRQCPHRHVLER